jgi:uncharacterized membrane protein YwaF
MARGERSIGKYFNGPLMASVLGVILGIVVLFVARFMITNFTFSQAQTNRAKIVNDIGRIILIVSLLLAASLFVKRVGKDLLEKK